jgi:4-amino-4-deoxy-L-arabinose transferase-like glycosyltransferase
MQPHPRSGRGTRLSLLGIGLLALLAVVAFASRSGLAHHGGSAPSPRYTSYAMTVFMILFVLMIPVAVYAFTLRIRERRSSTRKSFKARLYASAARWSVLVLIVFVSFYLHNRHPHLLQNLNPFSQANPGTGRGRDHVHKTYNPKFQWSVLWIALVLFSAIAAYWYFRLKTRKPPLQSRAEELTVSEDLAATIDDAIDDLEAERDARRAVIAAYARMEAVLGRNGFQRVPSETAIEYLRRVLLGLTTRAEAVTRLTGLFQEAKFSKNDIDSTMKQAAIGALSEIRDGLTGATA